jgi:YggT family protein
MGSALVWLINSILQLVLFMIFARAIVSWLVAFEIINTRNRFVYSVLQMLEALTDPVLMPLRRLMPRLGGVDITPIVAWLVLGFVQILFNQMLAPVLIATLG